MSAETKEWHGMRRFRLRTLRRVNVETTMIAAGQNRKLLLTFGGQALGASDGATACPTDLFGEQPPPKNPSSEIQAALREFFNTLTPPYSIT
jgi:hypothetical protein